MSEERKQLIGKRFGDIDEKLLGQIKEVKDVSWPNPVKEYEVKGNVLKYQMIKDIEVSAERIAEIFRDSVDEMVGNNEYEWHHNPQEIIKNFRTGDWNYYGCYYEGKLISVSSMHIIRGQRAIQWVWGVVDPGHRGMGVWHNMGEYFDLIVQKSGAQMGFFWVVTTHKYSQMMAEASGFRPMGFFIGGEFMGGSDGRYYRQNVIYYGKLYGEGKKHLQKCETMELTDQAEILIKIVRELWTNRK